MNELKEKFFSLPLFWQATSLVVLLVVVFGIIGPSMVSSNSTVSVWIGIAICLATVYLVWQLSTKLLEKLKDE